MSRQVRHPGVGGGHAEDLVIDTHLVPHPEHADRPAVDQAAREGGLVQDDQRVKRIAVVREGVLDESVVVRVPGRGEEHPVQPDAPGLMIHFILIALALRDLDDHIEFHDSAPCACR